MTILINLYLLPVIFLSGMSALGCQILWNRYFSLSIGNTAESFTLITSFFILGIAFGSAWAAKICSRKEFGTRKRFYFFTELSLALTLAMTFLLIVSQNSALTIISHKIGMLGKLISVIFIVFVPSVLMGLGFPLLISLVREKGMVQKLYGLNILGGCAGVILFAFVVVPRGGFIPLAFIIPVLSVVCALWVKLGTDKHEDLQGLNDQQVLQKADRPSVISTLLACSSGFVIFSQEVLWVRQLSMILGDRGYLISVILAMILMCLGISSFISHRMSRTIEADNLIRFVIVISLLLLLSYLFFYPEVMYVSREYGRLRGLQIVFVSVTFIVALISLGMLFPLTLYRDIKCSNASRSTGSNVGLLLWVNSCSSFAAALLSKYLIIPNLGSTSIYTLNILILGVLLIVLSSNTRYFKSLSILALSVIVVSIIQKPTQVYITDRSKVLRVSESTRGLFSLLQSEERGYEMYINNYRIVAPYRSTNVDHAQVGLAGYALAYNGNEESRTALNLGLGYGITVGAFLKFGVEHVDSVEILPEVIEATPLFNDRNDYDSWGNRVNMIKGDARYVLKTLSKKYDIVSANISSPYSLGGSYFHTVGYYQEVLSVLKDRGVYSQLIWGPHVNELVHSAMSVFKYVKLIPGYALDDFILVASMSPLQKNKQFDELVAQIPPLRANEEVNVFEYGERALDKFKKTEPRFVITDHRADLIYSMAPNMGLLWTYK